MRRQSPKAALRAKALAATKANLIARAGGRCEYPQCQRARPLDQHHVIKRSQLKPELADKVDNLVLLCRAHHDMTDSPIPVMPIQVRWLIAEWIRYELSVRSLGNEVFEFAQVLPDGRVILQTYVRKEV